MADEQLVFDTIGKHVNGEIVLRVNAFDAVSHMVYYVNYESG